MDVLMLLIIFFVPLIPALIFFSSAKGSWAEGTLFGVKFKVIGPAALYIVVALLMFFVWQRIKPEAPSLITTSFILEWDTGTTGEIEELEKAEIDVTVPGHQIQFYPTTISRAGYVVAKMNFLDSHIGGTCTIDVRPYENFKITEDKDTLRESMTIRLRKPRPEEVRKEKLTTKENIKAGVSYDMKNGGQPEEIARKIEDRLRTYGVMPADIKSLNLEVKLLNPSATPRDLTRAILGVTQLQKDKPTDFELKVYDKLSSLINKKENNPIYEVTPKRLSAEQLRNWSKTRDRGVEDYKKKQYQVVAREFGIKVEEVSRIFEKVDKKKQ